MGKKQSLIGWMVIWVLSIFLLIGINPAKGICQEFKLVAGGAAPLGGEEDLAVREFCKEVTELSKGRIKVECFGPELGKHTQQIERVMAGTQQVYHGELIFLGNIQKDLNIYAAHYVFKDEDHVIRFFDSDRGRQIWKGLTEKSGIKALDYSGKRLRRVMVAKRPLKSLDDFKNLKMRVPEIPLYQKSWAHYGASTTRVAWGEMYLAIKTGLAEGHDGPVDAILATKTYEVAPNMMMTYHNFCMTAVVINEKYFSQLPKDLQEVVIMAAKRSNQYLSNLRDEKKVVDKLKSLGVTIIDSEDLREQLRKKATALMPQLEAEDFWSKGLFEYASKLRN